MDDPTRHPAPAGSGSGQRNPTLEFCEGPFDPGVPGEMSVEPSSGADPEEPAAAPEPSWKIIERLRRELDAAREEIDRLRSQIARGAEAPGA